MKIILKNGAVIETTDTLKSAGYNQRTGTISNLHWTRTYGESLYFIDTADISAIIDDFKGGEEENDSAG